MPHQQHQGISYHLISSASEYTPPTLIPSPCASTSFFVHCHTQRQNLFDVIQWWRGQEATVMVTLWCSLGAGLDLAPIIAVLLSTERTGRTRGCMTSVSMEAASAVLSSADLVFSRANTSTFTHAEQWEGIVWMIQSIPAPAPQRALLFPPLLLHYSLVSSPLTTSFNMNLWGNPLRPCHWLEAVASSPIHLRVGGTFKRLCWNRRRSCLWERFKDGAALLTCTDGATSFTATWGESPMMHLGVAAAGSPVWTWWGVILIMETLGIPWPWNKWIKVFHSNNKKLVRKPWQQ